MVARRHRGGTPSPNLNSVRPPTSGGLGGAGAGGQGAGGLAGEVADQPGGRIRAERVGLPAQQDGVAEQGGLGGGNATTV
jgi:hypothetical protein